MNRNQKMKRLATAVLAAAGLLTGAMTGAACNGDGEFSLGDLRFLVFDSLWSSIPAGALLGLTNDLQDGTRALEDELFASAGSCGFAADMTSVGGETPRARLVFNGSPDTPGFNIVISGFRATESCDPGHGPTPHAIYIFSDQNLPIGVPTQLGYALVDTQDGETFSSIGHYFELEVQSIDAQAGVATGRFEFIARNDNDAADNRTLIATSGVFRMDIECGVPDDCILGGCFDMACPPDDVLDPETCECLPYEDDLCAGVNCVDGRCDPATGACDPCTFVICQQGYTCDPETGECMEDFTPVTLTVNVLDLSGWVDINVANADVQVFRMSPETLICSGISDVNSEYDCANLRDGDSVRVDVCWQGPHPQGGTLRLNGSRSTVITDNGFGGAFLNVGVSDPNLEPAPGHTPNPNCP
ncbi:MAG: hypothetical protein V3T70_00370 [Phycisphaerae bacterium]